MSTTSSHTPSTVSLADEEAVRRILVDTLFGLWATVNNLTRLRPSRHERYRVTMFGSARTEPRAWVYVEAKQMCSALLGGQRRGSGCRYPGPPRDCAG